MAPSDIALATSSLVNPFAQSHSQLALGQLDGLADRSAATAAALAAATMLQPVFGPPSLGAPKGSLAGPSGSAPSKDISGSTALQTPFGAAGPGLGSAASFVAPAPSVLDQHAHRLAAAVSSQRPGGWCLFVYNLAPEVEESVIWKLFGPFGAVQQVNLVKDAQTNKCKGFAFVTMSDYNQALMAVQSLNGYTLANRVLQVSFKTSKVRRAQLSSGRE